jgi:predicted nucleotide-binding protein
VVASPDNHIEGEILRLKLVDAKIKATLTQTKDGPRIFVFAGDEKIARAILKS